MCFPSPNVNLLLEGGCILCVRSNRQSSRHIHLETLGLSGIMFQVSGISIRYQVSGTMYQVRCIRYQVQCIRYQVLGVRYQLSGFSNRVSGIRYHVLVSGIRRIFLSSPIPSGLSGLRLLSVLAVHPQSQTMFNAEKLPEFGFDESAVDKGIANMEVPQT